MSSVSKSPRPNFNWQDSLLLESLLTVDSAMVRIPKAHHGIAAKPSNLIQKVGNIIAWFDKYRLEQKN